MKHLAFKVTVLLFGVAGIFLASSEVARAQGPAIVLQLNTDSATNGLWQSGSVHLNANFVHPNGIRRAQVFVDGVPYLDRLFPCEYGYPGHIPCHPQGLSDMFPTTRFTNGVHSIRIVATEAYGAASEYSSPLRIDNTVPAPPTGVVVEGGSGWHASPARAAAWTNPRQTLAPISAVRYTLCPTIAKPSTAPGATQQRCRSGEWAAPSLSALPPTFVLPAPGLWTLRVWLVDAARNANPDAATVIGPLGFDPTAPTVAGFAAQDPSDPARVSIGAADDGAPLSGGTIEVRRQGSDAWRELATEVRSDGLWAYVNDEKLRKGHYELRGTVVNAAGLQQGTAQGVDGQAKTLKLPIRAGSHLQAGRQVGKPCARRCHRGLRQQVRTRQGQRVALRARLVSKGVPIRDQPLEVSERLRLPGATWSPLDSVMTDSRGHARYHAEPGAARMLRFRYPGTALVRGDNATVALDVAAKTTLDVSRRDVVNGEYVTFRGDLKGDHVPRGGVLVEMQVFSRGKWRTFAQPRTNQAGGWRYQYRFETVSGTARFRFRARVRQQAGYPYATGHSRLIGVAVHGL